MPVLCCAVFKMQPSVKMGKDDIYLWRMKRKTADIGFDTRHGSPRGGRGGVPAVADVRGFEICPSMQD